jgi:phage-related protein
MTEGGWQAEFFLDRRGNSPVEEFLGSLDAKALARFYLSLQQLERRNVHAKEPLVRHLDNQLWELRLESRTNIYRVIYFFFTGRRIVLLHGFQKKTQKTPTRDIATARRRLKEFLEQERRG